MRGVRRVARCPDSAPDRKAAAAPHPAVRHLLPAKDGEKGELRTFVATSREKPQFGAKGCLAEPRCAVTVAALGSPLTARAMASLVA